MIVRFGYVAMSMELENCSPSKTVTLKNFTQLAAVDREVAKAKLTKVSQQNLRNTLRLLKNNKANKVMIYRFSSKLIPLATHPDLSDWDYLVNLDSYFKEIGDYVRQNHFRVSFHPDHYTLINSPKAEVVEASLIDLNHHHNMLSQMGLGNQAKLVTHVGGAYGEKKLSLRRFVENWTKVSKAIRDRITVENDDKTYTVSEVLELCEELSLPMVLDLHHFICNHEPEEDIILLFPRISATWQGTGLNPKIHISSPKSEKDFRSHHDYVNPDDIRLFLLGIKDLTSHLDVMVEAKQKDKAMLKLVEDLGTFAGIRKLNASSVEV
ncbi:UV DNA damage repair endonuclease UvsE [Desulfotomaculum defluvii]